MIAVTSFLFFAALHFILPRIPKINSYKNLNGKKKEWDSRTQSTIHAVVVSLVGLVVMWRADHFGDTMWLLDPLSFHNVAFSLGYILEDLLLVYYYGKEVGGSIGFIFHHVMAAAGYTLCLNGRFLSYYANFRIISEMSTPFLNFRWKIYISGNEKSPLYFWNGILLITTFFVVRIAPMPFMWASVYKLLNSESYINGISTTVHYTWLGLTLGLDILNVYWFNLLVRRAISAFSPKNVEKGIKKEN